jgi:AraC family transcriptional regulator
MKLTYKHSTNPQGATILHHQTVVAGIELAYYRHPPAELPDSVCQQHLIFVHTEVPTQTQVEQVTEGHYQTAEIENGDIIIIPAQTVHRARWNHEHYYLTWIVDPAAFERRLGEMLSGHSVQLLPQFCLPDTLLYGISIALKTELENPGFGGQLYVDSLLTTLSAHLLRHYCRQKPLATVAPGLPNYKLQQVLEYIHAHLHQDLALAELAAIAQVSPNYFATQFRNAIGYAPHQYVIRQRIERGKSLLLNSRYGIADIANQVGFAHQSHFTRHFKRLVGVTPKQFLKQQ